MESPGLSLLFLASLGFLGCTGDVASPGGGPDAGSGGGGPGGRSGAGGSGGSSGSGTGGTSTAGAGGSSQQAGAGGAAPGNGGAGGVPTGGVAGKADSGAPADAGGGAGAKTCSAVFCEDFEGGSAFDPAIWKSTTWGNGARAEIGTTEVHGGKRAAHFHLEAADSAAIIAESVTSPALDVHLFGRAFFYADYDTTRGHALFVSAGNFDSKHYEIGQYMGGWQLTAWGGGKEFPAGYQTKIPVKRWACLEWEMTKATGEMRVYIDGAEQAHYQNASAVDWTNFTEVDFGFRPFGTSTTPSDVYFDDIVLDTKRAPCQ
ncbi:MAG TPA: hypothetical protein VF395_13320 [Polyangiaceae bacterium]